MCGKIISNIIIGAGPAGLAVAARMRRAGIDFEMLEASDKIGASWHGHYDRLCLHTVKEYSHLPYIPFPANYPRYVPRSLFVEYLESYAESFDIFPVYKNQIKEIRKSGSAWTILTTHGENRAARQVIICTGANRVPNRPVWPGMEEFGGTILHSRLYKNPMPLKGKRVLVIGMGNTGAEIALDLAAHNIETYLSVRSAVNIVPRDLNGRPVQVTGKMLEKLPFRIGDWIGARIRGFHYGNLGKYGIKLSRQYPADQLRTTGKTPVIDLGTVSMIKEGRIKVVGDVEKFFRDGVQLIDHRALKADAVILATGYRAALEDIVPGIFSFLDENGFPIDSVGKGDFEGMFFVGFDNYKLGGILGTIQGDSRKVVDKIRATEMGR